MDVACSKAAVCDILERALAGAPGFSYGCDGKLAYDTSHGFRLYVDVIEIGGWGTIEQIHATKPLFDGCVASISDLLLLLRAVTVVNRGGEGDIWDFKWLLLKVVKQDCFPDIGDEELEDLCSAVELCLGKMGRLVVAAIIGSSNSNAAMMLLA